LETEYIKVAEELQYSKKMENKKVEIAAHFLFNCNGECENYRF
jgi:hypothetical protein